MLIRRGAPCASRPAVAGASRSRRSWHGHLGHDGARAGRPCQSGRDARATARGMAILAMTAHGRGARAGSFDIFQAAAKWSVSFHKGGSVVIVFSCGKGCSTAIGKPLATRREPFPTTPSGITIRPADHPKLTFRVDDSGIARLRPSRAPTTDISN